MSFKNIGIVAGIWAGLLGFLILPNQIQLMSDAETVLLETIPVDPRDLLRGDYVILRYVIADTDKLPADMKAEDGQPVDLYAWLSKNEKGIASVTKITKEEPPKGTLFIRGKVETQNKIMNSVWFGNDIEIIFGIEKYFVPEGKGLAIENAQRLGAESEVLVEVSLSSNGNALIKNLRINGEVVKF